MSRQEVEISFTQSKQFCDNPLFIPQSSIFDGIDHLDEEDVDKEWRSNKMIEEDDDEFEGLPLPQLNHVTSFELTCIEDHGKKLADEYVHYIDGLRQAFSPEELASLSQPLAFEQQEELFTYISGSEAIGKDDKNILASALQDNLEGKEVLMAISHSVPSSLLPGALILGSVILKEMCTVNTSNLPDSHYDIEDLANICHKKMSLIGLAMNNEDSKQQIQDLVESWMKIIGSVVKGTFRNIQRKRETSAFFPVHNLRSSQSSTN